MEDHWYRYEEIRYAPVADEYGERHGKGNMEIRLREFTVDKTTPKGVWIFARDGRRFVRRDTNKRYACPTVEEAVESFKARKRRQIRILSNRLHDAEEALTRMKSGRLSGYYSPVLYPPTG